jgi:hypothetical protein
MHGFMPLAYVVIRTNIPDNRATLQGNTASRFPRESTTKVAVPQRVAINLAVVADIAILRTH